MKNYFSVSLIIFLFLSIFLTIFMLKKQQDIISRAMPATTLFLESDSKTKQTGEEFQIQVKVITGENQMVSVDMVFNYDPEIIEVLDITVGDFVQNVTQIQKNIDNTNGKLIYSFYTMSENAKSGEGNLAVIKLKGKKEGVASLAFGDETAMYGLAEGKNVIVSATSSVYNISSLSDITPSPTPTIDETEIPTPSPTSEPTPTSAVFAAITLTPTPTLTPVPTSTSASTSTQSNSSSNNNGGGSSSSTGGSSNTSSNQGSSGKKEDLNSDGKVNVFDLSILLRKWNRTSDITDADLNKDGKVNVFDLSILLKNWNK